MKMRNIYVQDEIYRVSFGYNKGLMEGQRKSQYQIAYSMLEAGLSAEAVAKLTGLPLSEVNKLSSTSPPRTTAKRLN